jgi:hypothetical protein
MADRFYILVRGKTQGPFTVSRLRQMAKRGKFGRHSNVSRNGHLWRRATDYPELFEPKGDPKVRQGGHVNQIDDIGAVADAPTAAPSAAKWFYSNNGQQLGPVSMEILKHQRSTGELNADDLVWTNGMSEWKAARIALPGLFADADPYMAPRSQTERTPRETEASNGSGGGKAIASLVLGLFSLVAWIIPLFGFPVSLIGLVLGVSGISSRYKGLAITGLIISVLGLILSVANAAVGMYLGATGQLL